MIRKEIFFLDEWQAALILEPVSMDSTLHPIYVRYPTLSFR